MTDKQRILVVDDEPSMLNYLRAVLELDGYAVQTAASGREALNCLSEGFSPDLVLLDLLMPGMNGYDTLVEIRRLKPWVKVVMLSCESDSTSIVNAMRMGADDYITKPFRKEKLDSTLARCLKSAPAKEPANEAGEVVELCEGSVFACACPEMRKVQVQAGLVAKVHIPVLLLGESGTGKEVVAKLIHKLSPRAHRTFLKVNCAAVPAELLESELFGYEAGAFTGANKPKPGKFELCNHGTILLDEIGEMPPAMQAKLLHVLQDGQFSRLGGRSMVQVDVRVIAATNIDIEDAIASKKFREDLYYRLNGFCLRLPPLRGRRSEIPFLLQHFMDKIAARYGRPPLPLSQNLLDACQAYPWPGNLRELENFVKRYLVLGDEESAIAELRPKIGESARAAVRGAAHMPPTHDVQELGGLKGLARSVKDDAEMHAIRDVLQQTNWNRTKAAPMLKISYKALLYKIRQYGLRPPEAGAGRANVA